MVTSPDDVVMTSTPVYSSSSGESPGSIPTTPNRVVPASTPEGISPSVQTPNGLVHPSTKYVVTIGALTGVHGSSPLARAETETNPIANPQTAAVHVARMIYPEAVDTTLLASDAIVVFQYGCNRTTRPRRVHDRDATTLKSGSEDRAEADAV